MNMKDVYGRLFNSSTPKPEAPGAEPWIEPELPKGLPEEVRKAIIETASMDRKKRTDRAMEAQAARLAVRQQQAIHQHPAMQNMQGRLTPGVWSRKILDNLNETIFKPNERWKMGELTKAEGVMRINFPFGEVEMPISNESELERALKMAQHMLKVHEELVATGAIKREIHKSKTNDVPVDSSQGLFNSGQSGISGLSSLIGSNDVGSIR